MELTDLIVEMCNVFVSGRKFSLNGSQLFLHDLLFLQGRPGQVLAALADSQLRLVFSTLDVVLNPLATAVGGLALRQHPGG